jgi:hypothetical protein
MRFIRGSALAVALSLGMALALTSTAAQAQVAVGVSIGIAPPALPVYVQPPIPAPGYIWTPGYWAWGNEAQDYYWVPGTWVLAPQPGYLWTPPYWGWLNGAYLFHAGYWGLHVGFYGGIPYGFGYTGFGYEGGYWHGGTFFYNRSVNHITNVHITNVYSKTVINHYTTRVSYNGGPNGIAATPRAEELAAMHETHLAATPLQDHHVQLARQSRTNFSSVNHGRPAIAATARPGMFSGHGVTKARGAQGLEAHGMAVAPHTSHVTPPSHERPAFTAPSHTAPHSERPTYTAPTRTAPYGERPMSTAPHGERPMSTAPHGERPTYTAPTRAQHPSNPQGQPPHE